MVEQRVCDFLMEQNKPFSIQLATDFLAHHGLRKAAVQKALEALAEADKIKCKEFGKTKLYYANQAATDDLSKQEADKMSSECAQLTKQLQPEEEAIKEYRKALKAAQITMSIEQLDARISELTHQIEEQGAHLASLKAASSNLISKADKDAKTQAFSTAMAHWTKRRKMFKEVWDAVSENLDCNEQDQFEEMGVETDEAAGVELKLLQSLLPKKRRL